MNRLCTGRLVSTSARGWRFGLAILTLLFGTTLWAGIMHAAVVPAWPLNDTGIDWWADGGTNFLPAPPSGYPGQDASHGRDATQDNDADGHAGFSFTKLSATGAALPASATAWSCVRDNVTGLVWEIKTDDGGLRDRDWGYSWYNPDATRNGGSAGYRNSGSCAGGIDCDTLGYTQAVNQAGLCGARDWRLPNRKELKSIVDHSRTNPAIDTRYFPDETGRWYWSSSPLAYGSAFAWSVYVYGGYDGFGYKNDDYQVRLVRGGQALSSDSFDALLLLHGMNSGPGAWNEFIKDYWGEGKCVTLFNGKRDVDGQPVQSKLDVGACYVLRFGARDQGRTGLEGVTAAGPSSGDFSTTAELGDEVQAAIRLIGSEKPDAKTQVALLAHSRGGLAARAFLQKTPCNPEKGLVQSLTTVVTPHQGSQFGRAYQWLNTYPRPTTCEKPKGEDKSICKDWKTADFINGLVDCVGKRNPSPLDVRTPVIDYLSDLGAEIRNLNSTRRNLLVSCADTEIKFRWLRSQKMDFGYLARLQVGLYSVMDRGGADLCEQLSKPAANYLVDGKAWDTGTKYRSKLKGILGGDGIIQTAFQSPANWAKKPIGTSVNVWTKGDVLHTEAPAKTLNISNQLKLVPVPWWEPGAAQRLESAVASESQDASIAAPTPTLTSAETQARWLRWSSAIQSSGDASATAALLQDERALREALVAHPDSEVLQTMATRLTAETTASSEVGALTTMLALTATSGSATVLVDALLASHVPERKGMYRRALERLSGEVTPTQRAGVTEALLTGWRDAGEDADLHSLALALGEASEPAGVRVLIDAVSAQAGLTGAETTVGGEDASRANAAMQGLSGVWRAEAAGVLIDAFQTALAEDWPVSLRNPIARALSKTGSAEAVPALLAPLPEFSPADRAEVTAWVNGLAGRRWSHQALEDWLAQAAGQPAWVIRMVTEAVSR